MSSKECDLKRRDLKRKLIPDESVNKKKSFTGSLAVWNSFTVKDSLSVKSMKEGLKYKILAGRRTTTKYGERVILKLENCQLYLPEWYTRVTDEDIKMFDSGKYYILKVGEGDLQFGEFLEYEESQDSDTS